MVQFAHHTLSLIAISFGVTVDICNVRNGLFLNVSNDDVNVFNDILNVMCKMKGKMKMKIMKMKLIHSIIVNFNFNLCVCVSFC